jgi:hypothetical protein
MADTSLAAPWLWCESKNTGFGRKLRKLRKLKRLFDTGWLLAESN